MVHATDALAVTQYIIHTSYIRTWSMLLMLAIVREGLYSEAMVRLCSSKCDKTVVSENRLNRYQAFAQDVSRGAIGQQVN